ncbi:hypothetical protein DYB38_007335 [Aphanomyces astaci]|uniref:ADP-ribose 1''-phosphate phosphatase n=2 Tax=Aphanomyces astaci TaxID=112090 RepID=A0A397E5M9_APHAT|nr:hypothetical protein DYB38_007335 [Aphanomyces astaci]
MERIAFELYDFHQDHCDDVEHAIQLAPTSYLRRFIRESLTTRHVSSTHPNETLFELVDKLLLLESRKRIVVPAASIPPLGQDGVLSRIALFEGDITTLAADVIVNAANTAMLGCFQPAHKCIDNIIHDRAGPRLRHACASVQPDSQGERLTTGHSSLTPGFSLPASFVSHTVGPQLQRKRGVRPSPSEEAALASCYTTTLDESLTLLGATSQATVAFPCISTGLFGYPSDLATGVAVEAVVTWLNAHPTLPWKVIFNTFLASDTHLYQSYFTSKYNAKAIVDLPSSVARPSAIAEAAALIKDSDFVLISAGAGLSAAAGLDYTSPDVFAKHHPVMVKRGYRTMYEFIGPQDWTPALQWGYYFAQTNLVRYQWQPTTPVYTLLKALFHAKNTFIHTSNADGLFEQQGFPTQRIYTAQGDYSRLQCLTPCSQQSVWDIRPFLDRGMACLDPQTNEITDSDAIPRCPKCRGAMMLNVRGGRWFIESQQKAAYEAWLDHAHTQVRERAKTLVVVEIGAGFNTPGVLRIPNEKLAETTGVALVRLNIHDHDVPLTSNGVGVSEDAAVALQEIMDSVLQCTTT